jgi:hypothetical protein
MKIMDAQHPIWGWTAAFAIMCIPVIVMYSVGRYTVPHHYYITAILATIYSLSYVWVAYMFAKRALSQSQLNKLEKLHLPKE